MEAILLETENRSCLHFYFYLLPLVFGDRFFLAGDYPSQSEARDNLFKSVDNATLQSDTEFLSYTSSEAKTIL